MAMDFGHPEFGEFGPPVLVPGELVDVLTSADTDAVLIALVAGALVCWTEESEELAAPRSRKA